MNIFLSIPLLWTAVGSDAHTEICDIASDFIHFRVRVGDGIMSCVNCCEKVGQRLSHIGKSIFTINSSYKLHTQGESVRRIVLLVIDKAYF